MTNGCLNPAEIRPWWLRVLLFLSLMSPVLTGSIHGTLHKEHVFNDLAAWTAYATFIWLLVVLCVGLQQFVDWLTVASIFALTILMTGAILRHLHVWELIDRMIHGSAVTDTQQGWMDLIFRFMMILSSYPLAMLSISSFPATDLMRWISRHGSTKRIETAVIAAIFLRMLQNVAEVITRCMVAWKEENPAVILPRHRSDWFGSIAQKIGVLDWLKISVTAWCGAIAIQSLTMVPAVVKDFRRVMEGPESTETEGLNETR